MVNIERRQESPQTGFRLAVYLGGPGRASRVVGEWGWRAPLSARVDDLTVCHGRKSSLDVDVWPIQPANLPDGRKRVACCGRGAPVPRSAPRPRIDVVDGGEVKSPTSARLRSPPSTTVGYDPRAPKEGRHASEPSLVVLSLLRLGRDQCLWL